MIGKTFGSYKIVAQLGQGGMASVYRGYQEAIDRSVAIKVMPAELLHDPNFIKRFVNEARTLAKLSHPNILPLYDFGEANGVPYIIMPLMVGTLVDRIRGGPMAPREVARILAPIADALDYAHNQGLLHRDIKPNNILFDARDTPIIADFGIAKYMESASSLTGAGIIGTPDYMSPEQARGEPLDRRSDIYALAVMVYQMLTGQTLFRATTPMGVIFKHVSEAPRPLRQLHPELSAEIDAVVMKSLAKTPAERHQSCAEFARAFAAAAEPATRPAPPPAPTGPAPTAIEHYPPQSYPQPAAQPQPAKKEGGGAGVWLSVIGIVVAIALCAFIAFGMLGLGVLGAGTSSAARTEQAATDTAATAQARIAQEATATAQVVEATQAAIASNITRWTSWPVAYSDDFSYDQDTWPTGDYTDDRADVNQQIVGGVYRWEAATSKGVSFRSTITHLDSIADLYLTVDVRQTSGPAGADYGIVFRKEADDSFYYFAVSETGQFDFAVLESGQWTTLIDWTETDTIKPGQVNTITVVAEGAHFTFFINRQMIAEADDSRLRRGTMGLGIELFDPGDKGAFEFDNFVVRAP